MTLERKWIRQLQQRWPQVDLRHDTFFDPASRQIITADMLIEGVHFIWDYFQPPDLGWRSLAANLSDVAATGGTPNWILVTIGVPDKSSMEVLDGIYQGIEACCEKYHCTIVGGDTVHADKTSISVTVVGHLPQKAFPGRRHNAQPGDLIAISGPHGLSRAGMEALQKHLPGFHLSKNAHLRPEPQLRLGQQIAKALPRFAMMDSSDGLADAALRLAEASGVDIFIDLKRLKVHPEVVEIAELANGNALDWVLYGGEDFQLVVTLPPETLALFPELQPIGSVQPAKYHNQGQAFLKDGTTVTPLDMEKTFQHFTAFHVSRNGIHQEEPSI